MNNPGIDLEIWKNLRKKWSYLHSNGHKVSVEFKLVSDPNDNKKILAIDVIQKIDGEIVVQTVQKSPGEAFAALGIDNLSVEQLQEAYKGMARTCHQQEGQHSDALIVTMSPTTPTSGELRGVLQKQNPDLKRSVLVGYQHYYILNALREKMMEQLGESWTQATAIYQSERLEFYFDY